MKSGTICLDTSFPHAAIAAHGWLSLHWLPEKGVGGGRERVGKPLSSWRLLPLSPAALLPPLTGLKGDPRTRSWLSVKLLVHDSGPRVMAVPPTQCWARGHKKL